MHGIDDADPAVRTAGDPNLSPADLDASLDAIEAVQAAINRLEGVRAQLVDTFRRQAEDCEDLLIDDTDAVVRTADRTRRHELARRAAVADLATTLHVGEDAAHRLVDHSATLTESASRVLDAVLAGSVSWRKATVVAREIDDLTTDEALRVESAVLPWAASSTPGQLAARVRRAREVAHPTPAEVRHAEAIDKRDVWLDPGRDGTAWLTAHLAAPFAHAVHDRLTETARQLRGGGDSRTTGQLRADVLADLLLDDGTLDLASLAPVGTITRPETEGHNAPSSARAPGSTHASDAISPGSAPAAGSGSAPDSALVPRAATQRGAPPFSAPPLGAPPRVRPARPVGSLAPIARAIRPRVNITVPVLTLLGSHDAPASLDGRAPVDADTARELCAHAPSFRRILTHPETGTVLSVGRTTFQPPADLKAVLAQRDATCRFPGCIRPAARTDLDHTVGWADGGTTSADNLAHLCRHHHVLKHQTRWRVRRVGTGSADGPSVREPLGGDLEWTSPTGRRHRTGPEPAETTRHHDVPGPVLPPDHDASLDHPGPPDAVAAHGDIGPPPF